MAECGEAESTAIGQHFRSHRRCMYHVNHAPRVVLLHGALLLRQDENNKAT